MAFDPTFASGDPPATRIPPAANHANLQRGLMALSDGMKVEPG